ncbi:SgcJ/EcaC family oxidoreductase [Streptomyces sp. RerS4]|uniref:SgcJ/EcaC family oxidoreductase n=1 Tax=Streptomyces sp. RerS4 TaxID=2942449 RepID=UPI00201C6B74|nr:SgcJ/EcaC family oxidoreductase [Streptomyces sp. RerS4]UQX05376.1 SgcJ/EcaC family oxidoreductase [Streptomyces sp. RerS4]
MTERATKAALLVEQAKEWAGHYGDFPNGEEGAVLSVPLRFRGTWDRGDADALADVFADNGSLLLGDDQLQGREQIRARLTESFAGAYRGTRVVHDPVSVRFLADGVAVAVTEGGVVRADQDGPAPEDQVRAVWVVVKEEGDWKLFSYQTSPVKG